MILITKPQKAAPDSSAGSPMFLELKGICVTLGMSKPPANITMFQFFSGIEKKVRPRLYLIWKEGGRVWVRVLDPRAKSLEFEPHYPQSSLNDDDMYLKKRWMKVSAY